MNLSKKIMFEFVSGFAVLTWICPTNQVICMKAARPKTKPHTVLDRVDKPENTRVKMKGEKTESIHIKMSTELTVDCTHWLHVKILRRTYCFGNVPIWTIFMFLWEEISCSAFACPYIISSSFPPIYHFQCNWLLSRHNKYKASTSFSPSSVTVWGQKGNKMCQSENMMLWNLTSCFLWLGPAHHGVAPASPRDNFSVRLRRPPRSDERHKDFSCTSPAAKLEFNTILNPL